MHPAAVGALASADYVFLSFVLTWRPESVAGITAEDDKYSQKVPQNAIDKVIRGWGLREGGVHRPGAVRRPPQSPKRRRS